MSERIAYSVEELAKATSLGTAKLYMLMASGELAYRKVGRRRIIPVTAAKRLFGEAA